MNEPIKVDIRSDSERIADLERRIERLEGVQGPEQGLVGESRSDEPTGHAEEAKPGERRVGETVERAELLRQIEAQIQEAQRENDAALESDDDGAFTFSNGVMAGLVELRNWAESPAEKRSGLSNVQDHPARDEKTLTKPSNEQYP